MALVQMGAIVVVLLALALLAIVCSSGQENMGTFRIAAYSRILQVRMKLSFPPPYMCFFAPLRPA